MLVFLDLETTGVEADDRICSIALIVVNGEKIEFKHDLVYEGKKIPPKASSINHITNEMLKEKPSLKESQTYKFLESLNDESTTLIAHNAKFDIEKLSACGFVFQGKIIDTLRVTKHLIPECEAFSLQFLRYELKLYKNEKQEALACGITGDLIPHRALCDAFFVKQLYEALLEYAPREDMYELSLKKVLLQKLEFGKYKGRYIEEISMFDRGYLEWIMGNIVDLDEDLRYSITYYL